MSGRDCQSATPTQLAGLQQKLFRPGGSRLPGGVADYPLQRRRVETADKATQPIDGALRLPHIPPRSRKEDAELLRTDFVTAATAAVDEVLHRAAHCAGPRRRIEHDDLRVDHPRGQMGHIVLQRADTAFEAAVAAPQAGVDSKVAEKHLGHLVPASAAPARNRAQSVSELSSRRGFDDITSIFFIPFRLIRFSLLQELRASNASKSSRPTAAGPVPTKTGAATLKRIPTRHSGFEAHLINQRSP